MPIREHVEKGTLLTCNFDGSFKEPEMVKPRVVVVLSPKIEHRHHLCTVVCLSTTAPEHVMPYHCQIDIRPRLPRPLESDGVWVKGDMVYAVGFHRLDLIKTGKDHTGKRIYRFDVLSDEQLKLVRKCVLRGMGLASLTKHL
ncbi:type II toxin-antitoxin system PemK/MazF family toxin [Bosea sp. BIWAKO-01]|uniref:type II toxin-antitoxin system PemK/MazF family toxin n=1 Tax=Bosea sp. BIWAKO-01 TaxID=506668 RepID=UPI000853D402|nr:type II toxin-antitoxin system PemK/MazF family toxin [Bosea sp. BIWAKO-01]